MPVDAVKVTVDTTGTDRMRITGISKAPPTKEEEMIQNDNDSLVAGMPSQTDLSGDTQGHSHTHDKDGQTRLDTDDHQTG